MDPPYADSSINTVVERLATLNLIGKDTVVIVTHSPHMTLNTKYAALSLFKEYRHGDSCIAVYRKEGDV